MFSWLQARRKIWYLYKIMLMKDFLLISRSINLVLMSQSQCRWFRWLQRKATNGGVDFRVHQVNSWQYRLVGSQLISEKCRFNFFKGWTIIYLFPVESQVWPPTLTTEHRRFELSKLTNKIKKSFCRVWLRCVVYKNNFNPDSITKMIMKDHCGVGRNDIKIHPGLILSSYEFTTTVRTHRL